MRTLIFLFLSSIIFQAQGQTFEWAKRMGDANYQYGYDIANDNSNNVFVTGYFQGTVDFDPGTGTSNLTSAGGYDVFIQKLDLNGNLLWAKSVGSTGGDRGFSISTDNSGNVYITGKFSNTVDFDPNVSTYNLTANNTDAFILKLDNAGNFVWAAQLYGTGDAEGRSITVDGSSNVYTCGIFDNTIDFDPSAGVFNLSSAGNDDIFIQKLDSSGNFIWAKQMGSTGADRGYQIAFDGVSGILTTGVFMSSVDFDPNGGTTNITSNGGLDIFVQKLDLNGNFQWVSNMGGTGHDYGFGITTDAGGNIISTGYFQGTADFDPGIGSINITSNGNAEIFIQKLDANGNSIWAKGIGGTSGDVGNSVTTDPTGNIYTTGFFFGSVDFDPGTGVNNMTSLGMADAFLLKLDSNGDFLWSANFGGSGYNEGRSVNIGNDGAVYSTGHFQQTVDFDHTIGSFDLTSAGNNDIYVQKIGQCTPAAGTDVIMTCDSLLWIDGNTYYVNNNSATFNITNGAANGCDSLVTLDLTINNSAVGTDTRTECDSLLWIDGNTYYVNNNSATFNIANGAANGCDSLVTLDLTVNTINSSVNQTGTLLTANESGATYQWLDCPGMTPISGATNQSYTATTNGDYAVYISNNSCSDTSICHTVVGVGIIENNFNSELLLYPNPTDGNFSIDLGNNYQNTVISITDLNGRTTQTKKYYNSQLLHLKLEGPAGVYFLIVQSENRKAVIRLIKE